MPERETTPASETRGLLPHHQRLITESGIGSDVAAERGYRSVAVKTELRRLGYAASQCLVPALLVPIHNVYGEQVTSQIRPDHPRIVGDKKLKYETPAGSRQVLDVPPRAQPDLADPNKPLFVTEGARKADAAVSKGLCCIGVNGVWGFRGRNGHGGKTVLADWGSIALNGRKVFLVFDSDVMEKAAVAIALRELKNFLERRDANVRIIYLPAAPSGGKQGLDDFFAAGHSVHDLLLHATEELRGAPTSQEEKRVGNYIETPDGIVQIKTTNHGEIPTLLTNFRARIVEDISEDDGAEQRRVFGIEAQIEGQTERFRITAERFLAMNWPTEHLGAQAIVHAGMGTKDHTKVAIQSLSTAHKRRVFTHTGWRQIAGAWAFLHGDGAIGPEGVRSGVEVILPPALVHTRLPDPPNADALRHAVRACMRLLRLGPDRVMFPLLLAPWCPVLGEADFSIHLSGETGTFKTTIATLLQQHFGASYTALSIPGSFSSTENAIEELLFLAKDMLVVVDDLAPPASGEMHRLHGKVDRIYRGQGNRSARTRMRPDGTIRPPHPPRGMALTTGELVLGNRSARARLHLVEIEKGDIDITVLSACQQDADSGLYASAMAGFIRWMAFDHDTIRSDFVAEVRRLRGENASESHHRRTATTVAYLKAVLGVLLRFAVELGALDEQETEDIRQRGLRVLGQSAEDQRDMQMEADPVRQFLRCLRAAITAGRAHVAAVDGGPPRGDPAQWGWRPFSPAAGGWQPQGEKVGWVDGADLYLESTASFAVAHRMSRDGNDPLPVTLGSLRKQLLAGEWLASTETRGGKRHLEVRRSLEGQPRRSVLHLLAQALLQERDAGSNEEVAQEGPLGQLESDAVAHRNLADGKDMSRKGQPGQLPAEGETLSIDPDDVESPGPPTGEACTHPSAESSLPLEEVAQVAQFPASPLGSRDSAGTPDGQLGQPGPLPELPRDADRVWEPVDLGVETVQ